MIARIVAFFVMFVLRQKIVVSSRSGNLFSTLVVLAMPSSAWLFLFANLTCAGYISGGNK